MSNAGFAGETLPSSTRSCDNFFMKTDGRKSERHTLPHICLPNISPPTPTPLLQVLSISGQHSSRSFSAQKISPSFSPSLNVPLPHLVGKYKWLVPYGVGSKKTEGRHKKKSRKENPQKLTQLSSRSHPRHLVGKKNSTKRHHHRHHKRQRSLMYILLLKTSYV